MKEHKERPLLRGPPVLRSGQTARSRSVCMPPPTQGGYPHPTDITQRNKHY